MERSFRRKLITLSKADTRLAAEAQWEVCSELYVRHTVFQYRMRRGLPSRRGLGKMEHKPHINTSQATRDSAVAQCFRPRGVLGVRTRRFHWLHRVIGLTLYKYTLQTAWDSAKVMRTIFVPRQIVASRGEVPVPELLTKCKP